MRNSLALTVLLCGTVLVTAQQPTVLPARYGVLPSTEAYPQDTPKAALSSVLRAIDKGRIDYLAAHLIDPAFIDAKIAERAQLMELEVEKELLAVRDAQRVNPPRTEPPLPQDPLEFLGVVRRTARDRSFDVIVREIRNTLAENPDHIKDFRKFLTSGTFVDAGDASSVLHKELVGRQLFFRRIDGRWYMLDQQRAEAGAAKKGPEAEKK